MYTGDVAKESNEMYKFTCLEEGYDDQGVERETFAEAFADMYRYVRNLVDSGALTLQVLETGHWIEEIGRAHV